MTDARQNVAVEELVSCLYQAILGRDPDPVGLSHFARLIRQGGSLRSIIAQFITSPERGHNEVISLGHMDALPRNEIDLDLSANERQLLWQHVTNAWSQLGRDDPYWSVITSEEFRKENVNPPERIEQFYETGRADIVRAERYLHRHGLTFPKDGVCVDYGCGLGRATRWLAARCRRILAIDVSEPHLALARKNLSAQKITNVDFLILREHNDLKMLHNADCFYSTIALQHSPPPLIVEVLLTALSELRQGGWAFFQVPTYAIGYSWNFHDYVAKITPGLGLEMHLVPQSFIFSLGAQAGCIPLEVQPDSWVGNPGWISNTFLFVKTGSRRR